MYMSLDLGILIQRKNKKISLYEVNLSTDQKRFVKFFKTPRGVLAYLERNNPGYEGFAIEGFRHKKA